MEVLNDIENNLRWREKENIDNIFQRRLDPQKLQSIRIALHDGFYGVDKRGYPVYWCQAGLINFQKLLNSGVTLDEALLAHLQIMEFNQRVLLKEASKLANRTVYQTTTVLDMKGFTINMINRAFWTCLLGISQLDEKYYYEFIASVYFINVPMVFRIFWKTVQGLLSLETRKKVKILSHPTDLYAFIDSKVIPYQFEGKHMQNDILFSDENLKTQYSLNLDQFIENWKPEEEGDDNTRG